MTSNKTTKTQEGLDPEHQRNLDERLYNLHAQLQAHIHTRDRGEFEGLSEGCRTIIEDYTHEPGHRIWQFGTKLVDADWERQWRSGEGVYYVLFGDIERNRSAKYLHAVFTELVRCVADEDAESLLREYAQKLEAALKCYLITCRPDLDVASDPAPVRYGPDRDQNGIFYCGIPLASMTRLECGGKCPLWGCEVPRMQQRRFRKSLRNTKKQHKTRDLTHFAAFSHNPY